MRIATVRPLGAAALVAWGCAAGSGALAEDGRPAARSARPSIVGIVTDASTRRPIFANVIVLGTRIGTQTDGTGMFKLVVPDSGVYTIQVMHPGFGYEKQQRSVKVVAGRTTTLIVRLKEAQPPKGTVLDTAARH